MKRTDSCNCLSLTSTITMWHIKCIRLFKPSFVINNMIFLNERRDPDGEIEDEWLIYPHNMTSKYIYMPGTLAQAKQMPWLHPPTSQWSTGYEAVTTGERTQPGKTAEVIPLGSLGGVAVAAVGIAGDACLTVTPKAAQISDHSHSTSNTYQESTWTLWSSFNTGKDGEPEVEIGCEGQKGTCNRGNIRVEQELAEATHQTSVCAWVPLLQHTPCSAARVPRRKGRKADWKTEPAWPDPQVSAPATWDWDSTAKR